MRNDQAGKALPLFYCRTGCWRHGERPQPSSQRYLAANVFRKTEGVMPDLLELQLATERELALAFHIHGAFLSHLGLASNRDRAL